MEVIKQLLLIHLFVFIMNCMPHCDYCSGKINWKWLNYSNLFVLIVTRQSIWGLEALGVQVSVHPYIHTSMHASMHHRKVCRHIFTKFWGMTRIDMWINWSGFGIYRSKVKIKQEQKCTFGPISPAVCKVHEFGVSKMITGTMSCQFWKVWTRGYNMTTYVKICTFGATILSVCTRHEISPVKKTCRKSVYHFFKKWGAKFKVITWSNRYAAYFIGLDGGLKC